MDDLAEISLSVDRDSPSYAATLISRIFAAAENLELFPRMGRLIPNTRRDDIREITVEHHRVIYLVADDVIAILRVRHGARQLGEIPSL